MKLLRTIVAELIGLFVDDGLFAATILIWVILIGVLAPTIGVPALWQGVFLFAGLVAILAESVARRSRCQ